MSVFLLSEHGAKVSCEVLFGLGLCGYLESLSPVVDRWAGLFQPAQLSNGYPAEYRRQSRTMILLTHSPIIQQKIFEGCSIETVCPHVHVHVHAPQLLAYAGLNKQSESNDHDLGCIAELYCEREN